MKKNKKRKKKGIKKKKSQKKTKRSFKRAKIRKKSKKKIKKIKKKKSQKQTGFLAKFIFFQENIKSKLRFKIISNLLINIVSCKWYCCFIFAQL